MKTKLILTVVSVAETSFTVNGRKLAENLGVIVGSWRHIVANLSAVDLTLRNIFRYWRDLNRRLSDMTDC
jgi:hypothetical protein